MREPVPAPTPDLTGHLHGFALRYGGEEVAVYRDFDGANEGFKAAKLAMAELAACLASPKTPNA
jgi:hypothetical protein